VKQQPREFGRARTNTARGRSAVPRGRLREFARRSRQIPLADRRSQLTQRGTPQQAVEFLIRSSATIQAPGCACGRPHSAFVVHPIAIPRKKEAAVDRISAEARPPDPPPPFETPDGWESAPAERAGTVSQPQLPELHCLRTTETGPESRFAFPSEQTISEQRGRAQWRHQGGSRRTKRSRPVSAYCRSTGRCAV
jgi:hypothetical protein